MVQNKLSIHIKKISEPTGRYYNGYTIQKILQRIYYSYIRVYGKLLMHIKKIRMNNKVL